MLLLCPRCLEMDQGHRHTGAVTGTCGLRESGDSDWNEVGTREHRGHDWDVVTEDRGEAPPPIVPFRVETCLEPQKAV